MALLQISETPDPRLRTISTPVEAVDDELRRLMDDMLETMYDAPGIGLAAIQVGVPKRVLVIDLQDEDPETGERQRAPMFFVNPDRKSTRRTPVTNAHLVCRLLLEKKKKTKPPYNASNQQHTP